MRNIDSHKQEAFPYHWRTLATKTGFHQAFHGCQLRISRRVTGGPRVKTPVALVAIECCLGCCLKHLHLHVFGGRVLWGVCRSALWKQTSSEPKIHAKENQNRYIVLISNITGIVNPIETCSPSFFQHLRRGVALLHLHMGYHWNLGSAPNQGKMLSQGTQCASHRPGLTWEQEILSVCVREREQYKYHVYICWPIKSKQNWELQLYKILSNIFWLLLVLLFSISLWL